MPPWYKGQTNQRRGQDCRGVARREGMCVSMCRDIINKEVQDQAGIMTKGQVGSETNLQDKFCFNLTRKKSSFHD